MPTRYDPISGTVTTTPDQSTSNDSGSGGSQSGSSQSGPLSISSGGTGLTSLGTNAVNFTDSSGALKTVMLSGNQILFGGDNGPQVLTLATDSNLDYDVEGSRLILRNYAGASDLRVSRSGGYDAYVKKNYYIIGDSDDDTSGNLVFTLHTDFVRGNQSIRIIGCGYKNFEVMAPQNATTYMGDTLVQTHCVSTSPFCSLEAICVQKSPLMWILVPQEGNFAIS